MGILGITDPTPEDKSIEEYEHFEYVAITDTNLNDSEGDIRIIIEKQNSFTHPSESYLLIEGRLTKTDETAYADADNVSLTNNAMMHLFKKIKYQLSDQTIETILYPGQVTTMLGLLKIRTIFLNLKG